MSAAVQKPTPPGEYECCESGCSPCIWDSYYEDLREWQAQQTAAIAGPDSAVVPPDYQPA